VVLPRVAPVCELAAAAVLDAGWGAAGRAPEVLVVDVESSGLLQPVSTTCFPAAAACASRDCFWDAIAVATLGVVALFMYPQFTGSSICGS